MQPKIKNKNLQKQIDQLFNREEVICASIAVRDADADKFVVATRLGTVGGDFEAAAHIAAKLYVWSATKRIGLTGQTQEQVQAAWKRAYDKGYEIAVARMNEHLDERLSAGSN
jgi:hypothetical protein